MIWNIDEVPEEWPVEPLSALASKIGSGATPRGGRSSYAARGVPLIRSQNVHFDGFNPEGLVFLSDAQAKKLEGARVDSGDVLLNITGASIGRVCTAPPEMQGARVNQHVCIIRQQRALPEFLRSYLSSPQVQEAISRGNYGATREALTKAQILELPVPLPPVEVQESIVATLGSIQKRRSSAIKHLASAQTTIERFRVASLAAAYRRLSDADSQSRPVPLKTLLREPLRNGYSARPIGHPTPFRVLTLTATTSGVFDPKYFKYTDEVFGVDSPFWLEPGDILVQRGNTAEFVGIPALYEGRAGQFLYPDLMIRARVSPSLRPRFVWYMLLAPQTRSYLRDRATGSAGNMPKINQEVLADVGVPLPPLAIQDRIVSKLDAAFALSDAVVRRIHAASVVTERSAHAVLAKAFRGELAAANE